MKKKLMILIIILIVLDIILLIVSSFDNEENKVTNSYKYVEYQDKKKLSEVKKYLIVGLTNLLNASKKGDDKNLEDRKSNEYEPE